MAGTVLVLLVTVAVLLEAHGGRVSAEGDLGAGTTIHAWFPEA